MEEQADAPLWRYTTLKIGGEARRLCQPASIDELASLVVHLNERDEPWYILGGGSNLLVSSKGVKGTVIRTTKMTGMINPEPGVIEAEAGARLPHLSRYAASLGLQGLEFAVGIPGTVGGGVIMNAGAHKSCMANVIEEVTVFDTKTNDIRKMGQSQLGFKYRCSNLDTSVHVVLSARFRLDSDSPQAIEERIRHNEAYRWKTQPLSWPNAGSTFKNPEPERGAGFLLDQAGAKSLKEGQAAVSAVHANFVINMGNATSDEVSILLRRMQECVYSKFQIRLHPEWKRLGEFTSQDDEMWN